LTIAGTLLVVGLTVPSGTVSPTTNRVPAIVSAAILRFLILPTSGIIQTVRFRNIVVFLHLIRMTRMGFCRGRKPYQRIIWLFATGHLLAMGAASHLLAMRATCHSWTFRSRGM